MLDYVRRAAAQSAVERASHDREKTGVFTGRIVTNPVNGEQIPIWVADYVLMEYGTGAIMAVPAHDERDFEFARQFDLPIRAVVAPADGDVDPDTAFLSHSGDERLVNSDAFDGLPSPEAKQAIVAWLEERGLGRPTVGYRLRDWLLSRQRYWGCPIPIVYCADCGHRPGAGRRPAGAAAGGRRLPPQGPLAARRGRGLGERDLPELRRPGAA